MIFLRLSFFIAVLVLKQNLFILLTKKVASFQSRSIIGIIINLKFLMGCTYATKKLRYLLLFAVIAIAATVVWYFAYLVKTPQYSLGLIGTAVQKHEFLRLLKSTSIWKHFTAVLMTMSLLPLLARTPVKPDSGCVSTEYQRCCRPDPDRPDQTIRQRRCYGRSRSK